jgi:proteasome beta subunit
VTLIISIPTRDSIVLASDSQITMGGVRTPGQKIHRLNSHCAWGAAGELALIQRVQESIASSPGHDQPLMNQRDALANTVKECMTSLLRLDFRTQFISNNPDALLCLHQGDFIFAECRSAPSVLHVTVNGTPEWVRSPYATGSGAPFAFALLQKYADKDLTIGQASVLAHKVIEEAILVAAYGLGLPVCMWHITSSGAAELDDAKVAAIADAARFLREEEVRMLTEPPGAPDEMEEAPTPTPGPGIASS